MMKMIRVLIRKGLNLDECFRHLDFEGRGLVDREHFLGVIRSLNLPFRSKDIFALCDTYVVPTLQIDYESFINDAMSELNASVDGDDSIGSGGRIGNGKGSPHTSAIVDLKRMLADSKARLRKSDDDIYRMFSRWDNSGRGLVTITQFFRVLAQLHIVLDHRDQDVVADILDVDSNGKVDFDYFLGYCVADENGLDLGAGGVTDGTDESLLSGGASTGGGTANSVEIRSGGSGPAVSGRVRPHTAAAFRGASSTPMSGTDRTYYSNYGAGDEGDSYVSYHDHNGDTADISPVKSVQRRPLTASGRVLNGEYRAKERGLSEGKETANTPVKSRVNSDDGNFFILDIVSDEEDKETNAMDDGQGSYAHTLELVSPDSGNWDRFNTHPVGQHATYAIEPSHAYRNYSSQQSPGEKLYDNEGPNDQTRHHTQVSQQQRSGGSRSADRANGRVINDAHKPAHSYGKDYNGHTNAARRDPRRQQVQSANESRPYPLQHRIPPERSDDPPTVPIGAPPSAPVVSPEAVESARNAFHSAIIFQYTQYGSTLRDLFALIDKNGVRYFNPRDLMLAANKNFGLPFGPQTATALVKLMALDGNDRVSFSEFVVFVNDSQYEQLERKLQVEVAGQLEQQGREYQYLLFSVLSHEGPGEGNEDDSSAAPASGLVSAASFGASLLKLGLQFDSSEIERIVTRFDTHGTGQCSVSRFMNMIQGCEQWKATLETLAYHEEAIEECQVVRQRMRSNTRHAIKNSFDEETLEMAEYLGIRILSEPHLLWIVEKAVRAPLPAGWSVHTDKDGRTFFYNSGAGITRWDHPLDPHFRQLRDEQRKKQQESERQHEEQTRKASYSKSGASRWPIHEPESPPRYLPAQQPLQPALDRNTAPAANDVSQRAPPSYPRSPAQEDTPAEEDVSTGQELDDDEVSDYYKLRRKPVPREKKGSAAEAAARPLSANDESQTRNVKDRQERTSSSSSSTSKKTAAKANRPVSAPFDRVGNEHTYRTKPDPSPAASKSGPRRSVPSQPTHPVRHKPQPKTKGQVQHNILLPGGIYTTGFATQVAPAHTSSSSRRVIPSSNRGPSPQRPSSRGSGYNAHGHKEKKLPASGERPLPTGGRPMSRSDRNKLNRMFENGVIDQLDDVILGEEAPIDFRRTNETPMRRAESTGDLRDSGRYYSTGPYGGSVPKGEYKQQYDR